MFVDWHYCEDINSPQSYICIHSNSNTKFRIPMNYDEETMQKDFCFLVHEELIVKHGIGTSIVQ
jgi:hypothetical protein